MGFCVWSLFCNAVTLLSVHRLAEEERAGCLALSVILLSCLCQCSAYVSCDVMDWSVVCDCGISWSYSLASKSTVNLS